MNKNITLGLCMFLPFLFTSCAKYFAEDEEEEEENNQKTTSTLHINPRSGDETELIYPIHIYAFDTEGKCTAQQTINSSEEGPAIELGLPKGTYRIVALSGAIGKNYILPEKPSLTDYIEFKQDNKAETPLMMGNADVTLKNGTAKANITLSFSVAQIKITLLNIPPEYSSVEVELASSYSKLSFQGEYGNSKNTLISCWRTTEGAWNTDTFYTFAGSQNKTIISIHLTKEGVTETYGYTYNNSIQANHPFILTGNYAGSITVEGNIIAGSWGNPLTVDFSFGKGNGQEEKPGGEGDKDEGEKEETPGETFYVDQIPEEESIWEGCLVVEVTENNSGNEADVLLMGIDNAVNSKGKDKMHSTDATTAIKEYSVSNIYNWRIPSKIEAQLLKSRYNENLSDINKVLSNAGGTKLVLDDPRYLCNNATLSFNFKSNKISNVGPTVTYYLRPVKTIHVIKK